MYFAGTSAAAPHAGAIAALIKSANPSLTAAQVRAALLSSAIDIEAAGPDRDSGIGIVMADTAVQSVVLTPTVSSVSPSSGSVAGNTTVTITGTNFVVGGTTVTIGGSAAIGVTVTSATSLTAVTPAHAAGTTTVSATAVGSTGSLAGGFTYFVSLFTDDPLQTGLTPIKTVHIAELRGHVDTLRGRYGLAPFIWSDPTFSAGTTPIKAIHVTELRSALADVYAAAGRTAPSYTAIAAGTNAISAAYIVEIRAAIVAIY